MFKSDVHLYMYDQYINSSLKLMMFNLKCSYTKKVILKRLGRSDHMVIFFSFYFDISIMQNNLFPV